MKGAGEIMFQLESASPRDREALLCLYALQKGRDYCFWTEDYPAPENVDDDLAHDALFVMKDQSGTILAAVSIERDEQVDRLPCWNARLAPAGEIARLAVHPAYQNQGLGRRMVAAVMQVLKDRGYHSIHLLVNSKNIPAIRTYGFFRFVQAGECDLYNQHFLCLEKDLSPVTAHPFPPLFDEHSRVLILGSFPSVKSRENMFFYGHPQNRFWRVVSSVFAQPVPQSIPEKKQLILGQRLALWDSIAFCEVTGSSDASIRSVIPNDLRLILDAAPIERIYCNGRKSHEIYHRLIEPLTGRTAECLPSTSPANAQWNLDRLTEAWSLLKKIPVPGHLQ